MKDQFQEVSCWRPNGLSNPVLWLLMNTNNESSHYAISSILKRLPTLLGPNILLSTLF
jgi:hypothetical protein